jgi:hypothetical protein
MNLRLSGLWSSRAKAVDPNCVIALRSVPWEFEVCCWNLYTKSDIIELNKRVTRSCDPMAVFGQSALIPFVTAFTHSEHIHIIVLGCDTIPSSPTDREALLLAKTEVPLQAIRADHRSTAF